MLRQERITPCLSVLCYSWNMAVQHVDLRGGGPAPLLDINRSFYWIQLLSILSLSSNNTYSVISCPSAQKSKSNKPPVVWLCPKSLVPVTRQEACRKTHPSTCWETSAWPELSCILAEIVHPLHYRGWRATCHLPRVFKLNLTNFQAESNKQSGVLSVPVPFPFPSGMDRLYHTNCSVELGLWCQAAL